MDRNVNEDTSLRIAGSRLVTRFVLLGLLFVCMRTYLTRSMWQFANEQRTWLVN